MSLGDRVTKTITGYSKVVIVALLLATLVVGAGITQIESSSSTSQFQSDSPEVAALEYVNENFSAADDNVTSVQVIVRNADGNVLSKDSLLRSLRYQQEVRDTPDINRTLADENAFTGISNLVATSALRQEQAGDRSRQANGSQETNSSQQAGGEQEANGSQQQAGGESQADAQRANGNGQTAAPSLDRQIATLESMSGEEVDATVAALFGNGDDSEDGSQIALQLMPSDFEPDSTPVESTSRSMLVRQETGATGPDPTSQDVSVTDAQLQMQEIGQQQAEEQYITFGFGILSDEIDRSMTDSLLLVGPLALVFVLITLAIAYRDLLDILLGFVGILLVLVWTFGFMGWADIQFNQIMVAVPVLLIGLSIDYAIHIFMRHREQRTGSDRDTKTAMAVALGGVGVALVWVTATSVIGFLSNLVSALPPIQDFGLVSSVGIVAALIIFGALIPALKTESDELLERFGFDREKRAFGTGGGRLSGLLTLGATAARRAPMVVIVLVLLLTVTSAAAGSQVSTSFSNEDFIADDPPEWMDELPEPFAPGDYTFKQNLDYINENFQRQDSQSQVLLRGDVATDEGLDQAYAIERAAADHEITYVLPNGQADVQGPVGAMRAVAAANPESEFAARYQESDVDDDPAPDENVQGVLDAFAATAPQQASNLFHRVDGEYVATRVIISTPGTTSSGEVTDGTREIAAESGSALTATATGSQVVNEVVQSDLFDSVIESLLISLVAVFGFLMVAYRITEGSFTLGIVTLLPVALSVAWILGTMYAIGVPFNVLTGTITSLTIGLGVAYSIHISERYRIELERQGNIWSAMETAVTGTGGALLGSAATTVGGFGTLAIAILPPLRQFGIITGLTIIYAFLASVLVLPTLLVVWTRWVGPSYATTGEETDPDGRPTGGND